MSTEEYLSAMIKAVFQLVQAHPSLASLSSVGAERARIAFGIEFTQAASLEGNKLDSGNNVHSEPEHGVRNAFGDVGSGG